jgi:ClpP class serine protease
MKLTELLTSPWAILPASLREIQAIYATHLKGEKIDLAAVEARLGRPLNSEAVRYEVRNGVAVLPVEGVLAPKANLFTAISGGASYQMLAQQVQGALADSRVKSIVQYADTPGGSVFGMYEYAALLHEAGKVKPIVTVSDGNVASAGYLAAAATNTIFLTGPAVNAGSIGIYSRMSMEQTEPGVMEFARGKYKRPSLNGQAPSAEYMAYLEAQLDHHYTTFVDAVAQYRGTKPETVLERMADGRVFIGQQAIDAGLADGFASLDDVVERMATNPAQFATRSKAVFALGALSNATAGVPSDGNPAVESAGVQSQGNTQPEPVLLETPETETPKGTPMDIKTLAEQHPELLAQIQAEARAAGAQAETARVASVRAQSMKGHEALIDKLATDGKTTGPEAAMAVLAAERAAVEARGKAFVEDDAPQPAKTAAAPSDKAPTKTEQVAQAKAYAAEHKVDFIAAMKKLGFAA